MAEGICEGPPVGLAGMTEGIWEGVEEGMIDGKLEGFTDGAKVGNQYDFDMHFNIVSSKLSWFNQDSSSEIILQLEIPQLQNPKIRQKFNERKGPSLRKKIEIHQM